MILHNYSHGDHHHITAYYGHGFGSIFARIFSKVAAKTASRAALSAAKKVGSTLVKTGMKKVVPMAKKTITTVVKKGMKKAVPIAKKMIKKGVKRAADEAQSAIANKVRKVEEIAINKGVPAEMVHSLSTVIEDGSRQGIDTLSKLAEGKSNQVVQKVSSFIKDDKSDFGTASGKQRPYLPKSKIGKVRSTVGRRKIQRPKVSSDLQNLIDYDEYYE